MQDEKAPERTPDLVEFACVFVVLYLLPHWLLVLFGLSVLYSPQTLIKVYHSVCNEKTLEWGKKKIQAFKEQYMKYV